MTTTQGTAGAPDRVPAAPFVDRRPCAWIAAVVDQIAAEAGLAVGPDLEDRVILAYVGVLDSPDPHDLCQERLLQQSRHALLTWAWEQGTRHEALPTLPGRNGA